jgi:purine-binding chemotaxis protein CheW
VFEVTVLDRLDPPPAIGGNWSSNCIAGIGRRNGNFVIVLDLDHLLGSFEFPVQPGTPKAV